MKQTAAFTLETDKTQLSEGEEFLVAIFVDSGGQEANTVFTRLSYNPAKLSFLDFSFKNSAFPNIVEKKVENGQIKLTNFSTSPYSGDKGLLTVLKFKAEKAEKSEVKIESVSKIHANDGQGSNLVNPNSLPIALVFYPGETKQATLIKKVDKSEVPSSAPLGNKLADHFDTNPFLGSDDQVVDYSSLSKSPRLVASPEPTKKIIDQSKFLNWLLIFLLLVIVLYLVFNFKKLIRRFNNQT